MGRPTTKKDLIEVAGTEFNRLWALIDDLSETEQNASFLFEDRDKNLRDVLVHLHEWHNMLSRWHQEGTLDGGSPKVPGQGYTWRTLPGLNQEIWAAYQDVSLEEAKALLTSSHEMILSKVEPFTNEDLFSKNVYKWTKSSTLGAYFVSATSSHYNWAMKKIKKHRKLIRQKTEA